MSAENGQFDGGGEFKVDERFGADLKRIYRVEGSVGIEVDRAVMDAARAGLGRRDRSRFIRYAIAVGSVAAVFVCASLLYFGGDGTGTPPVLAAQDINADGVVNIVDALKLARKIEVADVSSEKWDFNDDGVVDQADVDNVAMVAVAIEKEGVL